MKLTDLMPDISTLIPYGYEAIKTPLYEGILVENLKDIQVTNSPVLHQVSGAPGSGKSIFCHRFLMDNPSYVYVSFDKIMEMIPSYQQDVIDKGPVEAFSKWELPARIIGYELLCRLIEMRANILLEHSGTNMPHVQLMHNVQQLGYKTHVDFLLCDVGVSLQRAQKREKETGRHTPIKLILERSKAIKEYYYKYHTIVKKIQLYETSYGCFQKINTLLNIKMEIDSKNKILKI